MAETPNSPRRNEPAGDRPDESLPHDEQPGEGGPGRDIPADDAPTQIIPTQGIPPRGPTAAAVAGRVRRQARARLAAHRPHPDADQHRDLGYGLPRLLRAVRIHLAALRCGVLTGTARADDIADGRTDVRAATVDVVIHDHHLDGTVDDRLDQWRRGYGRLVDGRGPGARARYEPRDHPGSAQHPAPEFRRTDADHHGSDTLNRRGIRWSGGWLSWGVVPERTLRSRRYTGTS